MIFAFHDPSAASVAAVPLAALGITAVTTADPGRWVAALPEPADVAVIAPDAAVVRVGTDHVVAARTWADARDLRGRVIARRPGVPLHLVAAAEEVGDDQVAGAALPALYSTRARVQGRETGGVTLHGWQATERAARPPHPAALARAIRSAGITDPVTAAALAPLLVRGMARWSGAVDVRATLPRAAETLAASADHRRQARRWAEEWQVA